MLETFSFSGQVRSLTYVVISKLPHGHKMQLLRNAANCRQSPYGRWQFQKVASPRVLKFCSPRIFHAGHLAPSQSRDLAHYKPTTEYWNCSFCNINDIIRTYTHQLLLSCTAGMSPYLIFAFLALCCHRWRQRGPLGSSAFRSITSDQIEIEGQKRHHCARTELPNRLICDLTPWLNSWP